MQISQISQLRGIPSIANIKYEVNDFLLLILLTAPSRVATLPGTFIFLSFRHQNPCHGNNKYAYKSSNIYFLSQICATVASLVTGRQLISVACLLALF